MSWIHDVVMCADCRAATFKGNDDVRFRKCQECGRIGCDDLVSYGPSGSRCVPDSADSCLTYVDNGDGGL